MKKEPTTKFPRFFDVDDTFVKVDYDPKTDEVFGVTARGGVFPPLKAFGEGREISKEEYDKHDLN